MSSSPLTSTSEWSHHVERYRSMQLEHARLMRNLSEAQRARSALLSSRAALSASSGSSGSSSGERRSFAVTSKAKIDDSLRSASPLGPSSSPLRSSFLSSSSSPLGSSEREGREGRERGERARGEFLCHARDVRIGVPQRDHFHRLRLVPLSFTGAELSEWVISSGWSGDPSEAVDMCQALIDADRLVPVRGRGDALFDASSSSLYQWRRDERGDGQRTWRWHVDVMRHSALTRVEGGREALLALDGVKDVKGVDSVREGRGREEKEVKERCEALRRCVASLLQPWSPFRWALVKESPSFKRFHARLAFTSSLQSASTEATARTMNAKKTTKTKGTPTTTAPSIAIPTATSSNAKFSTPPPSLRQSLHEEEDEGDEGKDEEEVVEPTLSSSSLSFPSSLYVGTLNKTVSVLNESVSTYLNELIDFRTRRRREPLFASGHDVELLGENTRIVYLTTSSPLSDPHQHFHLHDLCLFQDRFFDRERGVHIFYEMSVNHTHEPTQEGCQRALVLFSARSLRPLPDRVNACELTMVTQVEVTDSIDELMERQTSRVPQWVIDRLAGQPSAPSLDISSGDFAVLSSASQVVSVLPSPQSGNSFLPLDASASFVLSMSASQPMYVSSEPVDDNGEHGMSEQSPPSLPVSNSMQQIVVPDLIPLAVLGRGAYSKILQVIDKGTGCMFAMKVLRKVDIAKVQQEQHVITEQSILSRMVHPFVARLYYAFQSTSKLYMVMSYAAGGDLFTLLRRRALSEDEVALYTAELVCALRYIHRQGVVHRDLKPENILIDAQGHLLLVDFGLSHNKLQNQTSNSRTYSISGTSEYLAPEMIIGTGHDESSDFWQLGIVLSEMLTGRHPFYHRNLFRMQQNILHKTPVFDNNISIEARSLMLDLLHKNPEKRAGRVIPMYDESSIARGAFDLPRMIAAGDIESYPFFIKHRIDWFHVESRMLQPAFVPELSSPADVSNFDASFTAQTPTDTPEAHSHFAAVSAGLKTAVEQIPLTHRHHAPATSADSLPSPKSSSGGYAQYYGIEQK